MVNIDRYTYRVIWSNEDSEHVALCAEFPSLSFLADTPTSALEGLMNCIDDVVKDMQESGEDIPEPITCKSYSGNFILRLAPEQHKNLAILAAEQGLSLNRLIASKLG